MSAPTTDPPTPFWANPLPEVLRRLETTEHGLASAEAARRLRQNAAFALRPPTRVSDAALLLAQFRSPTLLVLLTVTAVSYAMGSRSDALIVFGIVLASAAIGFWNERSAARACARLLALVRVDASVVRDGAPIEVHADTVVPGDVVRLRAGDLVPADCRLLESHELFVDEAALTGETYPVDKVPGSLAADAPIARRSNVVWLGTHVVSGAATAVVVATGRRTEFGRISDRLRLRPPETEFERGVRRFAYLLLEVTLVLVFAIFVVNMYLHRPVVDSLLFSIALAVGLTPQLLPAIVSVNLAHGARAMARAKVIVKRLVAIENFGGMDVLCSDKTGTLTEGSVTLRAALDVRGDPSERVLLWAAINATFENGFGNPIDRAIRAQTTVELAAWKKLDEIPYDFVRKRLSILATDGRTNVLVTKGALAQVLAVCETAELPDGTVLPIAEVVPQIETSFERWSAEGCRVLGVCRREVPGRAHIERADEAKMAFVGLLVFADPPKNSTPAAIARLGALGIAFKVVTGDNARVARAVAESIGIREPRLLLGSELRELSDAALFQRAPAIDLFAEVEPNQKERIILALKKAGHSVGFLGDGINDAPALHAADVGISVEGAVDVAKDAADIVLLEKDLGVLAEGVLEGRRTFANTLKYVYVATSANFGNMFSMAGATLFVPFLPLLPKQVLLTNLLTDLPEMAIASDRIDPEALARPRRWDVRRIRNFMAVFGLLSSIFDYLTFLVLLYFVHAPMREFRTGWFVESVLSASIVALVIRSRRPLTRSRPGRWLTLATAFVALVVIVLPYTRAGGALGFVSLPPALLGAVGILLCAYVVSAEVAKRFFFRRARA